MPSVDYKYDYNRPSNSDGRPKATAMSLETMTAPDTARQYIRLGNISRYEARYQNTLSRLLTNAGEQRVSRLKNEGRSVNVGIASNALPAANRYPKSPVEMYYERIYHGYNYAGYNCWSDSLSAMRATIADLTRSRRLLPPWSGGPASQREPILRHVGRKTAELFARYAEAKEGEEVGGILEEFCDLLNCVVKGSVSGYKGRAYSQSAGAQLASKLFQRMGERAAVGTCHPGCFVQDIKRCHFTGMYGVADDMLFIDGVYVSDEGRRSMYCCECYGCERDEGLTIHSLVPVIDSDGDTFIHVCPDCANENYYRWPDDTYHDEEYDEDNVRHPDQGSSQRDTEVWKFMTEQVRLGVQSVEIPNNGISKDGINAIANHFRYEPLPKGEKADDNVSMKSWVVSHNGDMHYLRELVKNFLMQDTDPHAPQVEWATKEGTLPKRIGKFLRSLKIKPPTDLMGAVGSTAGAYCPKNNRYIFDVVTGKFNWRSGDFGDHGSCYWSCHSWARRQLQSQHNAFAIRFYKVIDGRPLDEYNDSCGEGRCWCVVQRGNLYLFNAYGPHSLLTIARIFATKMGMNYRKLDQLCNNDEESGSIYINSGRGYVIGKGATEDLPTSHDFEFDTAGDRR